MDWEMFRAKLTAVCQKEDYTKGGCPPIDVMIEPFSCVKSVDGEDRNLNPDIERFLKENAIQFAKEKKSITYLVGNEATGDILGYFTLAHKAVVIPADGLSKTTIKRMNRYAQLLQHRLHESVFAGAVKNICR